MYRHVAFTELAARNHRNDSLGNHDDKSHFQKLSSMTMVSEMHPPFLSLALALPVIDTTTVSGLQPDPKALIGKETQEALAEADEEPGFHGEAEESSVPGPPLTHFHAFGNLPPELRIKIWHMSFLPRVVELHPAWPNHDTDVRDDDRQQQQWQSGCSNPAALSVCSEAREIAIEHFRIAYPLASITTRQEIKICKDPLSDTSSNGGNGLRRRILYISPEYDIVALLGQDTDFTKLSSLLDSFRDADLKRVGISNLAFSTGGQENNESVTTNFDTSILKDLNQLVLFTYEKLWPPPEWSFRGACLDEQMLACFRKMGNRCELVPCQSSNAWYVYKQWRKGKGRLFWDNQRRILQVGKNRLRIQDLEFASGW